MGKPSRRRASNPARPSPRPIAVAVAERARQDWDAEVEEIFHDTHPLLRCDKLSNIALWAVVLGLLGYFRPDRAAWVCLRALVTL
jgi:hypothetical protein